MDAAFWRQRWAEGRTGWHHDEVMPLLREHWAAVGAAPEARVLVPLCGKSLDMAWLAAQGHAVRGIELVAEGIEAFLAGQGLAALPEPFTQGETYRAGSIELLRADVFDLPPAAFAGCAAIYDRAALIALPSQLRRRYAAHVYDALPSGCRGLLITLEFPQAQKEGPPFAVPEAEVRALLEPAWEVELLERRDILQGQPSFRDHGVDSLHTAVYRLRKD